MTTPRTAATSGQRTFGNRPVGAACTTCPNPVRIHIHLDANRDGVVDDAWSLNGSWSPGAGRLGAVVLCNCDDEDGDKREDHKNDRIDTADDNSDIAPFHLRKHPRDAAVPAGWKVVVEVLNGRESLFRIFGNERAAGTELLGPTKGKSFEITNLAQNEWKYGMETNQYPGRVKDPSIRPRGVKAAPNNWDGYVTVKLSLLDGQNVVQDSEEAKIRCAPWVMFNHLDPTEELYVVKTPDNRAFITDLDAASGMPARQWDDPLDRWMQDVMELGFSTLPRPAPSANMHLPAPVRTANLRGAMWNGSILDTLIKANLLGKNYGYYEAVEPTNAGDSLDSFGNLECVPPFTHPNQQREYKFGRIIYGHSGGARDVAAEVQEFLLAQSVQFPFSVDTGWLLVGHIDEVLSFVPTPDGRLGFKAVFAAPLLALTMTRALPPATAVLQGVRDFSLASAQYTKRTVAQILDTTTTPNIVRASEYAQTKIDQIKADIRREIGMTDADFIDLPILFQQMDTLSDPVWRLKCVAYTPGSVNMLVVTRGPQTRAGSRTVRLVLPKPFGPTLAPPGGPTGTAAPPCEFEKVMARALTLSGVTVRFVDDFVTYHSQQGEIHCGTNSKRKGGIDRFWWEQADI